MMDMELNAELDRDGGSDTEASTAGSSVGTVYCSLEQDFARITSEMKDNDALAIYEAEYTRLFEALYKSHRLEEELTEKCRILKEEVSDDASRISELEKRMDADALTIKQLKEEILDGKKLADAAHTREQRGQEVIENLRVSISKLTDELEQKNRQLNAEEHVAADKPKEGLSVERERLLGEVDALRQRLKTVTGYNLEIETKLADLEQKSSELQDKYDKQNNDMAKDRREREKIESELQVIQEELRMRLMDLQTAEETLKTTTNNAMKQENLLREEIYENDKNQKEIQKLMLKQMSMKTEFEKISTRYEEARKELFEKNKCINDMSREIFRSKEEFSRLRSEKENTMKKLTKEKSLSNKADENFKRISANLRSADLEILALKRQLEGEKKTIEKLNRDKDAANKNITTLEDMNKKLTLEVRVFEQTNRKMEMSLEVMTEESNEMQRQIKNLENERDRGLLEAQDLAQQVEDYMDEVKLKRLEISDYQKRLAEFEAKLRQQQTLFEDIRAERNSYKKNFSIAQEEIAELKNKVKNLNIQIDQLKDQLAIKEANLVKQEFLFSKMEKEKDALKVELLNSRKNISDLRHEIDEMRQEEKRLRNALREADSNIARQKKEIESVMNERDVIGTQIVRRNDELSLQYNKIQILTGTLTRGEKQYAERLDEIRQLKIEIKDLKLEKAALEKNTANLNDLRGEVYNLERNLTKERLKVMALEEEVQNPLNVHRWRNLEGTDPDTFELLKKIQLLQKRILKMSSEIVTKEKKIRDTEKLYMNLREVIAKQPGPEILVSLTKTRRALMDRSKKMKCLVAELNMTLTAEHKFEIDKMKMELNSVKSKYLAQKKKNLKAIQPAKENLPAVADNNQHKFHGGGFNLTTPKNITAPLITINK